MKENMSRSMIKILIMKMRRRRRRIKMMMMMMMMNKKKKILRTTLKIIHYISLIFGLREHQLVVQGKPKSQNTTVYLVLIVMMIH